ncbi:MAG: hypothetical protein JNG84_07225, partial [Archangium sp.]|nr:hypothetical protein [Archangium sp.]
PPQGVCTDTSTNKCVPKLLGMEGRVDIATLLASLGAPPNTGVDFSVAAGGNVQADDAGLTLGLRGGLVEFAVSPCVQEVMRPAMPNLPIPDFGLDAPGPYDLAVSMSHQLLSEALFRAQQSGALCLELGSERITVLDSSLLATLLPSLNKLTHGEAVPLRIVVRPVNPPTAVVGRGTFDSAGKPIDPLIRLDWPGLELDLYARIDDRYARIFTIVADLELPLGLNIDACGNSVTPVVGSLTGAVKNVNVINSEMLAEELDSLKMLVPTLLSLAEPSLANGLSAIAVPELPNLRVRLKLLEARGIGQRTGTSQYNHLGIYGQFVEEDAGCPVVGTLSGDAAAFVRELANGGAELSLPEGTYSVRVDNGLWLIPQATVGGTLHVEHPRLRLGGAHRIDVRDRLGTIVSVVTP